MTPFRLVVRRLAARGERTASPPPAPATEVYTVSITSRSSARRSSSRSWRLPAADRRAGGGCRDGRDRAERAHPELVRSRQRVQPLVPDPRRPDAVSLPSSSTCSRSSTAGAAQSSGALDPAAEAATRLWKTAAGQQRIPADAELTAVVRQVRQTHWTLNPAGLYCHAPHGRAARAELVHEELHRRARGARGDVSGRSPGRSS